MKFLQIRHVQRTYNLMQNLCIWSCRFHQYFRMRGERFEEIRHSLLSLLTLRDFSTESGNVIQIDKNCLLSISTEKNNLHYLWIDYKFRINVPLCSQKGCSCCILGLNATPPLSSDIYCFMFSLQIKSESRGKWEGRFLLGTLTGLWPLWEKILKVMSFSLPCQGFAGRKKWQAVTLSFF